MRTNTWERACSLYVAFYEPGSTQPDSWAFVDSQKWSIIGCFIQYDSFNFLPLNTSRNKIDFVWDEKT